MRLRPLSPVLLSTASSPIYAYPALHSVPFTSVIETTTRAVKRPSPLRHDAAVPGHCACQTESQPGHQGGCLPLPLLPPCRRRCSCQPSWRSGGGGVGGHEPERRLRGVHQISSAQHLACLHRGQARAGQSWETCSLYWRQCRAGRCTLCTAYMWPPPPPGSPASPPHQKRAARSRALQRPTASRAPCLRAPPPAPCPGRSLQSSAARRVRKSSRQASSRRQQQARDNWQQARQPRPSSKAHQPPPPAAPPSPSPGPCHSGSSSSRGQCDQQARLARSLRLQAAPGKRCTGWQALTGACGRTACHPRRAAAPSPAGPGGRV